MRHLLATLTSTVLVTLALLTLALVTGACGGAAAGEHSPYTPPSTLSESDGWLVYIDPPQLDASSAAAVSPGDATPEAAVTHFYASRLRGDQRYREVLVPDPSDRLRRGLNEYGDWTFRQFRLVGKKETAPGRYWIKIWFEIEIDGDTDDGTDEVGVREEDGRWLVESVPS